MFFEFLGQSMTISKGNRASIGHYQNIFRFKDLGVDLRSFSSFMHNQNKLSIFCPKQWLIWYNVLAVNQ
jgi:hypothetical protein